ncbi:universal stress protein [Nocardioides sp. 503]|uniref:universal stress protein n=1 Tax=Nocardioides sp. 503 TaxID=2508326 RepID=UPI0010704481|nr:universal stress protein [Nocardioides sp. 503]
MHVIVATDGSKQSLAAARHLKSFADPLKITTVSVVAVIRPYAAVAFADDLTPRKAPKADLESLSFRDAADSATKVVAGVFEGWGPKVQIRIRSGSPATEIIKAAKQADAGLVVVAAGSRGLSDTVLLGSTAQRVQHSAPCPVLVVRPAPRKPKRK